MKVKLTNDSIKGQCVPPAPGELNGKGNPLLQKVYMDEVLKGFGLVVSRRSKTFILQRDLRKKSVRVRIGCFPDWTIDEARKRGRELIVQMDNGINPNAAKRQEQQEQQQKERQEEWQRFTLQDAIDEHVENMRADDCSERSMGQIGEELERHCPDWLDRPLVELRRADCIDRHRRICNQLSEGGKGAGRHLANRIMRSVRACWNSARRRYEELPEHPVRVKWYKTKRRREPIPWSDLPGYWSKVEALPNPIRRDLRVFILLTGLRSEDARTVRWEHVDFEAGTIHRPKPKGGVDRAFTVPISSYALELLARRRMENRVHFGDDHGWAFPTRDMKGRVTHVKEPKEQKTVRGEDGTRRKVLYLPSPHRLRDTFATAGHEAGIRSLDLKILMNHALAEGDVTEGYIRPSVEHLRGCQEQITAFLLEKAEAAKDEDRRGIAVVSWKTRPDILRPSCPNITGTSSA